MSWEIPYLTKVMDEMDDSKVVKNIYIKKNCCIGCTEPLSAYDIKSMMTNGYISLIEAVNRFTHISEMMRKTIYKDCVAVYLKEHSQYRHMWE